MRIRSNDLPASSIVPQPTTLLRAPHTDIVRVILKNIAKRNDQCVTSADLGGYQNDLLPFSGTRADLDDKSVFVTSFILPSIQPSVFRKSRNMVQTTCINTIELHFMFHAQLIHVLKFHYLNIVITDYVLKCVS
jgi:hypothetical protein